MNLTNEELKLYLKTLPRLSDKDRDKRIKKAKEDFRFAVETYFAHHIDNSKKETSKFRNFIYKNIDTLTQKHTKLTFEAYRGGAKTTLISRLHTIWQSAIKRYKRNTCIISSTIRLSKETLDFIKTELEENENLISDFEIRKGDKWSEEEIIYYSGELKFRLVVYGAGTKIRGGNWLGFRPDLIVCDDIENDENVESKTQREKLYKWFTKAILKLPARQSTSYNIIIVGTKLHHDSLLASIQNRSDFLSFKFPLVLEFPTAIDDIVKNALKKSDTKGMLLDDEALDKFSLLQEYLEDKDSFMSEYQNQPLSRDTLTFSDYELYETLPSNIASITIGIDPALGKSSGDYFSIAILYYNTKNFYAQVKMYKLKATMMIDKIISIYISLLKHQTPIKVAIETVQFQEFFKDILHERSKSIGLHLPIVEIKNTTSKELRIDALSPLINNKTILVDKSSSTFIDELDTYPKAPHDDGLDSLEMAYRIAKKPAFDYKEARKHIDNINKKNNILKGLLNER